jgi:plastocyanin
MSFPNRSHLAIAALSLATLSSCGGGGTSTNGDSTDTTQAKCAVPSDLTLMVMAVPTIRWDASGYRAPAGDIKIVLENTDSVKHVLVVREGDKVVGDLELSVAKKGSCDEGTINLAAGEYSIYCIVPGHGGMNSSLTVF